VKSGVITLVLGGASGAVFGVGAMLLLRPPTAARTTERDVQSPPAVENSSSKLMEGFLRGLAVASAPNTTNTPTGGAGGFDPPSSSGSDAPDPTASRDYVLSQLADHENAVRDVGWSRKMENSIGAELDELARRRILSPISTDVDCRSTTCAVRVEWDERAQAMAQYRGLLLLSTNCIRSVTVDEPNGDPEQPGRATVLVTCSPQ